MVDPRSATEPKQGHRKRGEVVKPARLRPSEASEVVDELEATQAVVLELLRLHVWSYTVPCRKVKTSMTKLVQSAEFAPTLTLLALRAEDLVFKCRMHELVEALEGV